MDLLTLREDLETLLVEELGEYTLSNGATTPAISVRSVGEAAPANTKVRGLECIISRQPNVNPISQYEPTFAFRNYTLYLVSWDSTELAPIAEKIIRGFPTAVSGDIRPQFVAEGAGPKDQMRVNLQFNPEAAE